MVLPISHEKTLEQHVNKNQVQDMLVISSMRRKLDALGEENLMNSLQENVQTKSKIRRNQALKRFKENMSELLPEDSDSVENSNKTKMPRIIQIKRKTIFKHNLRMATHFRSKSKTNTCNLYNDTLFCDKALEGYQEKDLLNVMLEQKEKSSNLETNDNIMQTTIQTSHNNGYNISSVLEKKHKYEFNKSITIGKLRKSVHSKVRKEEILKSQDQFQNLNHSDQQEMYDTMKIYEQNTIETVNKKCLKETIKKGKKENSINTSTTSVVQKKQKRTNKRHIKTNKRHIKTKKNLTTPINSMVTKKLTVPLVKIEDLPLSEVSQLLSTPNYIENSTNSCFQEGKEMHYQRKDTIRSQYSLYRESFAYKNIEIDKNGKINLKTKSMKKGQCLKEDHLIEEKVRNTYIGQKVKSNLETLDVISINEINQKKIERSEITRKSSKSNANSLSKIEQYSVTESMHSQINNKQLILNVSSVKLNDNDKRNKEFSVSKKCRKAKRCKKVSYICNVCSKKYKREYFFLKHKINCNTDILKEKQIGKVLKDDSAIKFEHSILIKDRQDFSNDHKNNSKLNSTMETINEEINCNGNKNDRYIIEKKNITPDTQMVPNCNHILHINLTEKAERGIKRQNIIKFNINITKKCKTNDSQQEIIDNEVEDNFTVHCATDSNIVFHTREEEVITHASGEKHCSICNKKFNSQRMLKEHMFFLHDAVLNNSETSNLLMPYCTNYCKMENVFIEDIDKFKKEYETSSEATLSKMFMNTENDIYETIPEIYSIVKTNQKIKKWYCKLCKENFALIRNYLRHRYYCHNDESVVHICDNCNKVLTSVAMVNIHMCTNVSSWNCRRCNLHFANGISLTEHNANFHLEFVGPHVCNVCNLSFLTMYMLQKHKSMHSNNTNLSILSDKDTTCNNDNTKAVNDSCETNESFAENYFTSNIIFLPYDDEEVFKCKICCIICLTKLQMKLHLERWHNVKMEMCLLCNDLCIIDKLTKHLINHHIVFDNLGSQEDNIKQENVEIFQNDIVRVLGLKRLLSLCEYQRFVNVPKNECFNCITCLKEFSDVHYYKIHYLESHDTMCLLCNIEFKHGSQAFEHKNKVHVSTDVYLWVTQKIIAAILHLNSNGNTIEDVILQFSEKGMYNSKYSLNNEEKHDSKEEKLDSDKEVLYTVDKFQNFVKLAEVGDAKRIIIDKNNSNSFKHNIHNV